MTRSGSDLRILIVTLSNLGDVILTLPVFGALAKAYPEARPDVVVGASAKAIIDRLPGIGQVRVPDKKAGLRGRLALLRWVRGQRYDLIIDLRRSYIGLLGGAQKRNRYWVGAPASRHRADRHRAALVGILPEEEIDTAPNWGIDGSAALPAAALAAGLDPLRPYVVAAPGSKSDTKKWPAASYARALAQLSSEGHRIVLIGDEADRADVDAVAAGLPEGGAVDLCGRLGFMDLAPVIARASLLLTNDSAPLHLAEAVGTRSVALFGPTDRRKYGPRLAGSVTAGRELFCSPCEQAQCRYGTRECLTRVAPEEVIAAARRVLADASDRTGPRILALRLDRIGDVVLSLPALERLRQRFPTARITLLTRPSTRSLLEGHPDIDEVLEYDYGKRGRHGSVLGNLRFIFEMWRKRFDIAVVLNPSLRSYLIPYLLGIPYRIGFKWGPAFLLTASVPDQRSQGLQHESELTLGVLGPLEALGPAGPPRLELFADEIAAVRALLHRQLPGTGPLVAVHAGASCPSKRWPVERFVEAITAVHAATHCRVLLVGGEEERALSARIAGQCAVPCADLTGELTLRQLACALKVSDVLLTNDSGPGHVAAAVGTPVVTVFGRKLPGLGPRRWRTLGPRDIQLHKDVGCVSCPAHLCPIEFECLRAIGPDEVAHAVLGVLGAEVVGSTVHKGGR